MDKVTRIMQELTIEKNREVTEQLAELAKQRKLYNDISERELFGLVTILEEIEVDKSKWTGEDF